MLLLKLCSQPTGKDTLELIKPVHIEHHVGHKIVRCINIYYQKRPN